MLQLLHLQPTLEFMARPTQTRIDRQLLETWRLFLTAHADVIDALGRELVDECDLPLAWYEVLLYLHEADDHQLRMHELADSLLLSRSAVTRLIDRVEKAGLVCRSACESDRRGTFVVLTDEGRARFSAAAPVHLRGVDEHFTSRLDRAEAATMADAFRRIIGRD